MSRSGAAYALLTALAVGVALLWLSLGDFVGTILLLPVLALGLALVVAVVGSAVANAPAWLRAVRGVSHEEYLASLETSGKAVRERHRAQRALTFKDLSTSCLAHLVELADGRLLCLYGQTYFALEPGEDGPAIWPRRFPTREFSLLRERKSGELLALEPGAEVLDPIVCADVQKHDKLQALGVRLEDGALITGVSFEAAREALEA